MPDELTLRDRFAMAALVGFCANPNLDESNAEAANMAYEQADAMIEARKQADDDIITLCCPMHPGVPAVERGLCGQCLLEPRAQP